MKKNIYITILLLTTHLLFSQVIIGSNISPSSNSVFTVVNTQDNEASSKGFIITTANTEADLPMYNITAPNHFDEDPTMEGMIMYQKDIKRVVVYDGKKWNTTLYEGKGPVTHVSMNPTVPESDYPAVACILVGCGEEDLTFGIYNTTSDTDNLGILDPTGTVNTDFSNFTFKESGFYRVLISLKVKTSGLHVSPPLISFRALKNDNLLARNDVALNEAILITAGANRVGTMEFLAMFDKGDKLKVQVAGGVSLLTVADVYKIVPTDGSFINIEKL